MQVQSNKIDFKDQNIYVGFDVHLKNWSVTIMSDYLTHKSFSQPPKPEVLHQYLLKNFPGATYYSAYEAGYSGYWIHNKLKELGVNSIVVNPADIPTTDTEKDQKDDPRDSRKIARSLKNGDLIPIYVPTIKTLEDRTLVRTRSMLTKDLTRNKNRIKSFVYFHGIDIPEPFIKSNSHWSKRFMEWLCNIEMNEESGKDALNAIISAVKNLREQQLYVSKKITELSKTEYYKERVVLLRTIPGIGLTTAMIILTELESIDRFNNLDQLCRYIGFIPSRHSSGEKDRMGNLTSRGHSILRNAIIESAWVAARRDPALFKSYNEYCKRMKSNDAIIRIAKKMLSRISFVLKNKKPYEFSIVK
jgi:transposase